MIISFPDALYKGKGWIDWGDFLGTEQAWRTFVDAREFARSLKLRSQREWKSYRSGLLDLPERPKDIPALPDVVYKTQGWITWEDWLGCEKARPGRKKRNTEPRQRA